MPPSWGTTATLRGTVGRARLAVAVKVPLPFRIAWIELVAESVVVDVVPPIRPVTVTVAVSVLPPAVEMG
ncbi:unannotated protein [freshwater metagenome]|uniref:Unannotated protein n=1 Tax=freshwater metagenome TaxID=449393 RepID=A0A6J6QI18_9ZZZZ